MVFVLESEATATDAVVTGSLDEKGIILFKPQKTDFKIHNSHVFSTPPFPTAIFHLKTRNLKKSAIILFVFLTGCTSV